MRDPSRQLSHPRHPHDERAAHNRGNPAERARPVRSELGKRGRQPFGVSELADRRLRSDFRHCKSGKKGR